MFTAKYFWGLLLGLVSIGLTAQGSLQVITEPSVEKLQESYVQQMKKEHKLEGYRVQIYNGKKSECLKRRSEFLQVYPRVKPYTLYESPEYRVQVGDFRTRLEAEKFLRKIIAEFPGSFILKTKISWPELDKVEVDIGTDEN